MSKFSRGSGLLLLSACLAACGQNYSDKPAAEALAEKDLTAVGAPAHPPMPMAMAPTATTAGGLASLGLAAMAVPDGWEKVPPTSSMRVAEFAIAASQGGTEGSDLAVFQGNWGSIDDNVQRWYGQFSQPDGRSTEVVARRWELETEGAFPATLVDIPGTYQGGMGMGAGGSFEGYRMLGAIVNAGPQFYYLKLTGPEAEVAALREGFEGMIRSMRRS